MIGLVPITLLNEYLKVEDVSGWWRGGIAVVCLIFLRLLGDHIEQRATRNT